MHQFAADSALEMINDGKIWWDDVQLTLQTTHARKLCPFGGFARNQGKFCAQKALQENTQYSEYFPCKILEYAKYSSIRAL